MSNRFVFLIATLLLSSCIGKHNSNAEQATITSENTVSTQNRFGDTLKVLLSKSTMTWKGTKMRGAGKHEGEIKLKSGYFITEDDDIVNGSFVIDMTTIAVTDIPEHEPIPRNNLNNHLKSSEFFDVAQFPTAEFQITDVKNSGADSLAVKGNLTMKNTTKNITFSAHYAKKQFTAKFKIDRFQWHVAYEGNLMNKTLVDKDIELQIILQTE